MDGRNKNGRLFPSSKRLSRRKRAKLAQSQKMKIAESKETNWIDNVSRQNLLCPTPSTSAKEERLVPKRSNENKGTIVAPQTSLNDCFESDVNEDLSCNAEFNEKESVDKVQASEIQTNCATNEKNGSIEGRRIFDVKLLVEQLKTFGCHPSVYACSARNMEFQKECRNGFATELHFKCNMCNTEEKLISETEDGNMSVNKAVVFGNLCTGHSFAQMEERFSIMNMPTMSSTTYFKHQSDVHSSIRKTAMAEMKEAVEEEIALAVARNDVDKDGIPLLVVVVDGAWAKRSYKSNFNSLSGVACIMGFNTGKALFLGIRNMFCIICTKAENSKTLVPEHKCYKNWSGTANAMESDIILEGFLQSEKMYGVKYTRVIGDGDSSTMEKIRKARPYGIDQPIEKIECTNHVCRNFNTKLKDLSQKKELTLEGRKILSANLTRIRVAVHCAINKRSSENIPVMDKEALLEKDFRNTPYHVFGIHMNCADTSTRCEGHEDDANNVEILQQLGLWGEIMKLLENILIKQVPSLVYNVNNNHCERYNSVVAKFVGGKRCNFVQRDSYTARCQAAAASYNNRAKFYSSINKNITTKSPGKYVKRYQSKIDRKRGVKCKKALKFKKSNNKTGADLDYGRLAIELDLDKDEFNARAQIFLTELGRSENLHIRTINQSRNSLWQSERLKRLTASNFGRVCRMRKSTSRAKCVENLLYSNFTGSKATNWGLQHEKEALREISSVLKIETEECGLFAHKEFSFLGASPDGHIKNTKGIIEIKCPFSCRHLSPVEAARRKLLKFCRLSKAGRLQLKPTHHYFYQVQGQLEITDSHYCIFAVWTPHGISYEIITRDREFWKTEMKDRLVNFYMKHLLPELVDPRFTRNLPIRE